VLRALVGDRQLPLRASFELATTPSFPLELTIFVSLTHHSFLDFSPFRHPKTNVPSVNPIDTSTRNSDFSSPQPATTRCEPSSPALSPFFLILLV